MRYPAILDGIDYSEIEPFIKRVDGLTKEFLDGYPNRITLEFSTSDINLPGKLKYLQQISEEKMNGKGYWDLSYCPTCVGYHGKEAPFHVEIHYLDKGK